MCHSRHSLKISERSVNNFLSYPANTQTNRQTNKVRQKHYLLGGGNKVDTVAWTADEAGSHADAFVPLDRVKANVPGDERRTEVVIARTVTVYISSELLHRQQQVANNKLGFALNNSNA